MIDGSAILIVPVCLNDLQQYLKRYESIRGLLPLSWCPNDDLNRLYYRCCYTLVGDVREPIQIRGCELGYA